jgi:hypothetical protein
VSTCLYFLYSASPNIYGFGTAKCGIPLVLLSTNKGQVCHHRLSTCPRKYPFPRLHLLPSLARSFPSPDPCTPIRRATPETSLVPQSGAAGLVFLVPVAEKAIRSGTETKVSKLPIPTSAKAKHGSDQRSSKLPKSAINKASHRTGLRTSCSPY